MEELKIKFNGIKISEDLNKSLENKIVKSIILLKNPDVFPGPGIDEQERVFQILPNTISSVHYIEPQTTICVNVCQPNESSKFGVLDSKFLCENGGLLISKSFQSNITNVSITFFDDNLRGKK